jgi:small-conductance mechanosensitive channel
MEQQLEHFITNFSAGEWILVILVASAAALVLNKVIGIAVPAIVKLIQQHTDRATASEKIWRWRRLETFVGVVLAVVKALIFLIVLYFVWRMLNPHSTPLALVGASAIFVILAGATLGSFLRDMTYGALMIGERWYNVGDHIVVEPFMELKGVVEHVTLRSTKLRSLNGEVIWIHNQHIQGVRMTPRGLRTLAIDVFVSDVTKGEKIMKKALAAVPKGATMVARAFVIDEVEQLSDTLWRISAVGQTAVEREWLITDFAVKAIQQNDSPDKDKSVIVHGPIVRSADEAAEKRFKRSVKVKK